MRINFWKQLLNMGIEPYKWCFFPLFRPGVCCISRKSNVTSAFKEVAAEMASVIQGKMLASHGVNQPPGQRKTHSSPV